MRITSEKLQQMDDVELSRFVEGVDKGDVTLSPEEDALIDCEVLWRKLAVRRKLEKFLKSLNDKRD
jgi:hypothetical protein